MHDLRLRIGLRKLDKHAKGRMVIEANRTDDLAVVKDEVAYVRKFGSSRHFLASSVRERRRSIRETTPVAVMRARRSVVVVVVVSRCSASTRVAQPSNS